MKNFFKNYKYNQKGFTLMEVLLAISIVLIASVGVYYMLGKSQVSASIEMEQKHLDALSQGISTAFVTNGAYTGLTTELVANSDIPGLKRNSQNTLVSSYNTPIEIKPATVRQADDAFDIEYHDLNTKQCLGLVNNLYYKSFDTIIDGQSSQHTSGNMEGSLLERDVIIDRCSANTFVNSQGLVAFRFFTPKSGPASPTPAACTCSPQTQTQTLACPSGQDGSITQTRTSTCTGGTPECRTPVWSGWSTTLNTCSSTTPAPDTCPPGGCIAPDVNICIPATETVVRECPGGQEGSIVEQAHATCASPSAEPEWGEFTTIQNTCQPMEEEPAVCVSRTETRTVSCPSGQGGHIKEERLFACPSVYGSPVNQGWRVIENTCSNSCDRALASGDGACCRVSTQEDSRTVQQQCSSGQFGSITVQQERSRSSLCPTASSAPVWPTWSDDDWVDVSSSGSCSNCPEDKTTTQTNWVKQTRACPAGYSGNQSWEAQMAREQTTSYSCPTGTGSLPSPTVSDWTDWAPTGNTRNFVDSCVETSMYCAMGEIKGPSGWSLKLTGPYQGGGMGDRNEYDVFGAPPECTNGVQNPRGNWSSSDPWDKPGKAGPTCECNASRDGIRYQVDVYEAGGANPDIYTYTCNYPAKVEIEWNVLSMEIVGNGAKAVVSAVSRSGDTIEDTLSCSSFNKPVSGFEYCDSFYSNSTRIIFGRKSGKLVLTDYSYNTLSVKDGSYESCLDNSSSAPKWTKIQGDSCNQDSLCDQPGAMFEDYGTELGKLSSCSSSSTGRVTSLEWCQSNQILCRADHECK